MNSLNLNHQNLAVVTITAIPANIPCNQRLTDPGSKYAHAGVVENRKTTIISLILSM